MVQLSHPYITTGKTVALTRQTFVGKVMSLLFNVLSRLVIAFLPRRSVSAAAAAAAKLRQSCPTLATPWTAAYQAPPSMVFSRQEYRREV